MSKVNHFKIKQRSSRFSAFLLYFNLFIAETIVMKSISIKQRKNTVDHYKIFLFLGRYKGQMVKKMTISKIMQNKQWFSGFF